MRIVSERAFMKYDNSFFPIYTSNDLDRMINQPDESVRQKLDSLLRYLSTLSEFPGFLAEFDATNDYTVLGAKNSEEAHFYLESLAAQGLLSALKPYIDSPDARFTISAAGWLELD